MLAIFWVIVAGLAGLFAVGFYRLLAMPLVGSERRFAVSALARIESNLQDLRRVIVIADMVDDPRDDLRDAVKQNLERGVNYLFLVSASRSQKELQRFYRYYELLGDILRPGEKLVDIQELPYEWPTFPHVFYEIRSKGAKDSKFLVYRGSERRHGIARYYRSLDPSDAQTLAFAVLADAPRPIDLTGGEFQEGTGAVARATKRNVRSSELSTGGSLDIPPN